MLITLAAFVLASFAHAAANDSKCRAILNSELATYKTNFARGVDPSRTKVKKDSFHGDITTFFDEDGKEILSYRAPGQYLPSQQDIASNARAGMLTKIQLRNCNPFLGEDHSYFTVTEAAYGSEVASIWINETFCRALPDALKSIEAGLPLTNHGLEKELCESRGGKLTQSLAEKIRGVPASSCMCGDGKKITPEVLALQDTPDFKSQDGELSRGGKYVCGDKEPARGHIDIAAEAMQSSGPVDDMMVEKFGLLKKYASHFAKACETYGETIRASAREAAASRSAKQPNSNEQSDSEPSVKNSTAK